MDRITDRVNGERMAADLAVLAELTRRDQPGFTRLAYSEEDRRARVWLRDRMETAGLTVRVDAAANVIGRRAGESEGAVLVVGSHIDTVPNGGRFDGITGVVAGLEIARVLSEASRPLRHPLEVIAFTNEEPNAFGISTVGSRAMAGKLTTARARELRDPGGGRWPRPLTSWAGTAHAWTRHAGRARPSPTTWSCTSSRGRCWIGRGFRSAWSRGLPPPRGCGFAWTGALITPAPLRWACGGCPSHRCAIPVPR